MEKYRGGWANGTVCSIAEGVELEKLSVLAGLTHSPASFLSHHSKKSSINPSSKLLARLQKAMSSKQT